MAKLSHERQSFERTPTDCVLLLCLAGWRKTSSSLWDSGNTADAGGLIDIYYFHWMLSALGLFRNRALKISFKCEIKDSRNGLLGGEYTRKWRHSIRHSAQWRFLQKIFSPGVQCWITILGRAVLISQAKQIMWVHQNQIKLTLAFDDSNLKDVGICQYFTFSSSLTVSWGS